MSRQLRLITLPPVRLGTDWFVGERLRLRWDALRLMWLSEPVQEARRLVTQFGLFGVDEAKRILLTNLDEDARVLKKYLAIYGIDVKPLDDKDAVDSHYPERLSALRKRMV